MKACWLLALAVCGGAARAELWGYVDAQGVAHFSQSQLNGRYSLVLGSGATPEKVPGKIDHGLKMLTWLEFAPEVKAVQPYLREAAGQTGVDQELLKAVIAVESGYQHAAISPRGAAGLMQITSDTAQRYGSSADANLLDPRTNVQIGARMLADLIKRFGRIDTALAAWNAGEGQVRRAGGRMPAIEETQAHVHLVLELYWALLQRSLPGQARQMKIHGAAIQPPLATQ